MSMDPGRDFKAGERASKGRAAAVAAARDPGRAAGLPAAGGRARPALLKQPHSAPTSQASHNAVLPARSPGCCRVVWGSFGAGGRSGRVSERGRRATAFGTGESLPDSSPASS